MNRYYLVVVGICLVIVGAVVGTQITPVVQSNRVKAGDRGLELKLNPTELKAMTPVGFELNREISTSTIYYNVSMGSWENSTGDPVFIINPERYQPINPQRLRGLETQTPALIEQGLDKYPWVEINSTGVWVKTDSNSRLAYAGMDGWLYLDYETSSLDEKLLSQISDAAVSAGLQGNTRKIQWRRNVFVRADDGIWKKQ
jgi:hypothetical protein